MTMTMIINQQQAATGRERLTFDPTIQQIVSCCPDSELTTVAANWPLVRKALIDAGCGDPPTVIAAIATISVETHIGSFTFQPIQEFGDSAYFTRMYEDNEVVARQLGNTEPGDGARYCGRGYIQITGRNNYRAYGRTLGLPLEASPDLALEPATAARILASYFVDRGLPQQASAAFASPVDDWTAVRRAVNGGLNGYDVFRSVVKRLKALIPKSSNSFSNQEHYTRG